MKAVEGSTGGAQSTTGTRLNVKLVPLMEKDNIEAYLVTFERIMKGQNIGRASFCTPGRRQGNTNWELVECMVGLALVAFCKCSLLSHIVHLWL